jgi:hypothetical protein
VNRRDDIEREVEETILRLGKAGTISARPDFQARLGARLSEVQRSRRLFPSPLFRRPVLVPALLGLLIALNILSGAIILRKQNGPAAARRSALTVLAAEFDLGADAVSSYWK